MPTISPTKYQIIEEVSDTIIVFDRKKNIPVLSFFIFFTFFTAYQNLWPISLFCIVTVLLMFKKHELIIKNKENKLMIRNSIIFFKWVSTSLLISNKMDLIIERYKPFGIIWETKSLYAYQLSITNENKKHNICIANNKNMLLDIKTKIIAMIKAKA